MTNSESQSDKLNFKKIDFILPKLAELILQDAETCFHEQNKFSAEIYEQLHSVFPDILIKALDIVDRYKFIKYKLITETRSIFKLLSRNAQLTLCNDINFCTCSYFTEAVLKNKSAFTCEHVLSLRLAKIVNVIKDEVITNAQMAELLNNQMVSYLGFSGFSDSDSDIDHND